MASSPNTASDQLRGTAFHEAGHAVASVIERIPLTHVTIEATDDANGHCSHPPWPASLNPELGLDGRVTRRLRSTIRIQYAGVIAEAKANRTTQWNFEGSDGDLEWAADLALRLGGDGEGASRVLDGERAEAQDLIERHWNAVCAVAESLLLRRRLSGRMVRQIVRISLNIRNRDMDL